jgi:glutathione peroxidase
MRRLGGVLALAMLFGSAVAADKGDAKDKSSAKESPVLNQKMESLTGEKVDLSTYKGKVLLIVNVASKCGATPQYEQLEALHEKYKDDGLEVLGFPCNQFGSQEPGTSKEIAEFCKETYGVKFPMFSKIEVNGDKAAPLYKYLTSKDAVGDDAGPVKWNFEKFLVDRDGKVVARFRTPVRPDDPKVVAAIERELAKK